MGFFNRSKNQEPESESLPVEPKTEIRDITGVGGVFSAGYGNMHTTQHFDGEKTFGELGYPNKNIPNYGALRLRTYDAYAKTDVMKILTSRRLQWTIGNGLKLEVEPNKAVLKTIGIAPTDEFYSLVEARWKVYMDSNYCDYSEKQNLHEKAWDCKMGIFLGGDMLVVCRIEVNGINIQIVSGEFVQSPMEGDPATKDKSEANYIEHGIEYDERGREVAFYVLAKSPNSFIGEFERIEARGRNTGRRLAWMIYGQKLSHDHKRGVPEPTQIIEKNAKLDRYTEAAVGKAEKAANIVNTFEHAEYSTGDNPLAEIVRKKFTKKLDGDAEIDAFGLTDPIAANLAQTTSSTSVNLPPGASMKSFSTNIETNYAEFQGANFKSMAAALDTPAEVALQSYNSNYSASRAAINGWGHIVDIDIEKFANHFYRPIYKLWLEVEILKNNIEAPGYIVALNRGDIMIIESWSKCRFVGKRMPHIDPLKEAKAAREMLGDPANGVAPLISNEQAADMLNVGDWNENIGEYLEEIESEPFKKIKDATKLPVEEPNTGMESKTTV